MSFEEAIEAAVAAQEFSGVVIMATDKLGKFQYSSEYGTRTMQPGKPKQPVDKDTTVAFASCTKLMTAIAAMQCVEREELRLDDEVSTVLPELGRLQIVSIKDEELEFTPRKHSFTFRHLLSHSSGLVYESMSPAVVKWRESRGEEPGAKGTIVEERFNMPLIFEPGTDWVYGTGIDWAGIAVERVTGQTLEAYMKEHIWSPLGIEDITLLINGRPDLQATKADIAKLDAESGKVVPDEFPYFAGRTGCFGGEGAYGRVSEYLKILHSLLKDDEKLLKHTSMAELFTPQLSDASRAGLQAALETSPAAYNSLSRHIPLEGAKDFALGGMLSRDDYDGWRGKDTILWSGLPGIVWFIDRERELCGIMAPQITPPGDSGVAKLQLMFERGIYQKYAEFKSGKA